MSKLTSKSAAATVLPADIAPITIDPSGTPLSRKLTLSNFIKSIKNLTAITGASASDLLTIAQAAGEGRKLTWQEAMTIGASMGSKINFGTWFEDGGAGNGRWDPYAVHSSAGGTATEQLPNATDPQNRRFDNGYLYSGAGFAVQSYPVVVKWYAKLAGGTSGMDQQLAMARVVPSGMDPSTPSQNYARFRLFVQSNSDAFWQAQMNDGTAASEDIAATSLAASDTNWHWFEIRFNPASQVCTFYIDGTLEATLNTAARYPTASLGPMAYNRRFSGSGQYLHCARCWCVGAGS